MTNTRGLFAGNLKKYRHAAGLPQAALAKKANASASYVEMSEIGRKLPLPEIMERLAFAFGLDAVEFFLREATPDEAVRPRRKAAIQDVLWGLAQVFEERPGSWAGNDALQSLQRGRVTRGNFLTRLFLLYYSWRRGG